MEGYEDPTDNAHGIAETIAHMCATTMAGIIYFQYNKNVTKNTDILAFSLCAVVLELGAVLPRVVSFFAGEQAWTVHDFNTTSLVAGYIIWYLLCVVAEGMNEYHIINWITLGLFVAFYLAIDLLIEYWKTAPKVVPPLASTGAALLPLLKFALTRESVTTTEVLIGVVRTIGTIAETFKEINWNDGIHPKGWIAKLNMGCLIIIMLQSSGLCIIKVATMYKNVSWPSCRGVVQKGRGFVQRGRRFIQRGRNAEERDERTVNPTKPVDPTLPENEQHTIGIHDSPPRGLPFRRGSKLIYTDLQQNIHQNEEIEGKGKIEGKLEIEGKAEVEGMSEIEVEAMGEIEGNDEIEVEVMGEIEDKAEIEGKGEIEDMVEIEGQ